MAKRRKRIKKAAREITFAELRAAAEEWVMTHLPGTCTRAHVGKLKLAGKFHMNLKESAECADVAITTLRRWYEECPELRLLVDSGRAAARMIAMKQLIEAAETRGEKWAVLALLKATTAAFKPHVADDVTTEDEPTQQRWS